MSERTPEFESQLYRRGRGETLMTGNTTTPEQRDEPQQNPTIPSEASTRIKNTVEKILSEQPYTTVELREDLLGSTPPAEFNLKISIAAGSAEGLLADPDEVVALISDRDYLYNGGAYELETGELSASHRESPHHELRGTVTISTAE